ncbi:hypothetical protein [Rhodopirellula sp. JC639]|uniref:hypothetical protein n=1 Tax=Stieleria mannarensis TaxID=2755585 RepID=UPI00256FE95C|nr:hypothetical protein [Rhodopirellula sp. JC639]
MAYGLRTDFQGNLFTGSEVSLAWADTLTEIKAICHCGRKATMVLRIDDSRCHRWAFSIPPCPLTSIPAALAQEKKLPAGANETQNRLIIPELNNHPAGNPDASRKSPGNVRIPHSAASGSGMTRIGKHPSKCGLLLRPVSGLNERRPLFRSPGIRRPRIAGSGLPGNRFGRSEPRRSGLLDARREPEIHRRRPETPFGLGSRPQASGDVHR